MPWIENYSPLEGIACPQEGESYAAFSARCVPAIQSLQPELPTEQIKAYLLEVWAGYILDRASEATITIKRELRGSEIYLDEMWWSDWRVTDVMTATLPNTTYSSVAKAKAASGDEFQITKSVEEKQLVFGWANVAKEANGEFPLDWDGDVTTPEELENAAYAFVLKHRVTGEMHEGDVKGNMVESVMFTKEKMAAMGIPEGIVPEGWWVGFHIPDKEVFAKVKSGDYDMFSVQGKARRTPTGQ